MLDLVVAGEELLLLGGQRFVPAENLLLLRCINASRATRSRVLRSAEAARGEAIAVSMPQMARSYRSKMRELSCQLWFPCSLWLAPVNAF